MRTKQQGYKSSSSSCFSGNFSSCVKEGKSLVNSKQTNSVIFYFKRFVGYVKKLFQRLFRVVDDSARTFPVPGLGLFISIEFIKDKTGAYG